MIKINLCLKSLDFISFVNKNDAFVSGSPPLVGLEIAITPSLYLLARPHCLVWRCDDAKTKTLPMEKASPDVEINQFSKSNFPFTRDKTVL